MTTPTEPSVPAWKWPAKWVREESFWREMTTRTLSTILATATIGFIVLQAGLGSPEQQRKFVWSLVTFGTPLLLSLFVTLFAGRTLRPEWTTVVVQRHRFDIFPGKGEKQFVLNLDVKENVYPYWARRRALIMKDVEAKTQIRFNLHPMWLEDTYEEFDLAKRNAWARKESTITRGVPVVWNKTSNSA